jgi:hypothetical protein
MRIGAAFQRAYVARLGAMVISDRVADILAPKK